jgi:transaldolase
MAGRNKGGKKAATGVAPSVIEELAGSGGGIEVWWDSSPLIFDGWVKEVLAQTEEAKRPVLGEQLRRLYNAADPAKSVFVGCTTNPPLSWQAIQKDPERWRKWVGETTRKNPGASRAEMFWTTYRAVVAAGAEAFHPMFVKSKYKLGFVSGQVDPRILTDTAKMVEQGLALNKEFDNVMIKMPGTAEGILGIEELTARGIATNATLTFALSQLLAVAEAVKRGLVRARAGKVDMSKWRSVVTMMIGRVDDHPVFAEQAKAAGIDFSDDVKRWAGLAIFKKAYRLYKERGYESKMLAAALRVGPKVGGRDRVRHLEECAGGNVVLTVFPNVFEGFLKGYDAGEIRPRMDEDVPPEALRQLLKTEYFRQGYEEDGLRPDQWLSYPPCAATAKQFADATNEMETWVGEAMKG